MSADIRDQIKDVARLHRSTRHPVELDELGLVAMGGSTQPRRKSRSGPLLALAVAGMILLVGGGVSLLLSRSTDSAPTGSNPPPSSTIPAVTTTVPRTTTTIPATTTLDPETTLDPQGVLGQTLASLEAALEQDVVLSTEGYDVKTELEYIYRYLSAAQAWPEPQFDTSSLGVEIPLDPVTVDGDLPLQGPGVEGFLLPPYSDGSRAGVVPFIGGARVPESDELWVYGIVLDFHDGVVDVRWRLLSEDGASYNFGPRGPTEEWTNNILLVNGTDNPSEPVTIAGLPPEASVVSTTFADGTAIWQRPANGIVIFNDPERRCVTGQDAEACEGEFLVLDEAGQELMRITFIPVDDFPWGFRVDHRD